MGCFSDRGFRRGPIFVSAVRARVPFGIIRDCIDLHF
jgi:hypothetical protein